MAASLDDLATRFKSFDLMMKKVLDKVTGLELWKSSADASMESLHSKADDTVSRLQRLESAPPPRPQPPPQQPPLPPPPPPAWIDPFDLSLAPGQATRPPASALEQPSGHRVDSGHRVAGGGILGSAPPDPVTGTFRNPSSATFEFMSDRDARSSRSSPTPKIEFPKFDGQNPRLWKDRCELYFEVYNVSDVLKPRFAALNFDAVASSWLQTLELKGRVTNWEALHTAVYARFDKDQYHLHLK